MAGRGLDSDLMSWAMKIAWFLGTYFFMPPLFWASITLWAAWKIQKLR